MNGLSNIVLGFLLGLVASYLVGRHNDYLARRRDEWNASSRIRELLNALREKYRYSSKRPPESGVVEYFRLANAEYLGGQPLVDQLDAAVNEFKDFLSASDETTFEEKWGRARHEIRRMASRFENGVAKDANAQSELTKAFQEVGHLIDELKSYTLKLRRRSSRWW